MSALAIGLVVCGLTLIPLAIMVYLAAIAPIGFENETGFHLGLPENTHSPKIDE